MSMKGSNSDLTTLDLDSANSTPGIQRVRNIKYLGKLFFGNQ